jgi:DNA-binding PadR family transcriptional regulator
VLCLLRAAPLHPYGMQRLIKTWGKDETVNVGQRANLYKTIKRLNDAGLIEVRQTERSQLYPERTVYQLTEQGRSAGTRWLADMLATPRNEYPEFPAALSFAMALGPGDVQGALDHRLTTLHARRADLDHQLHDTTVDLPRITLLETEYQQTVLDAEIRWLHAVINDLKTGTLTWDQNQLATQAADTITEVTASAKSDPDAATSSTA